MATKAKSHEKMANKLDVLMVTYDSRRFVPKLLRKLLSINIVNRVYIYDNNSTDDTVKRIKEIKSKKTTLICGEKNIGFGSAMNILFDRSKNSYKLLLNPDTEISRTNIQNLFNCAKKHKADIAGGSMISMLGETQTSHTRTPTFGTILFEFTNLKKIFPNNYWSRKFHYLDLKKDSHPQEVGTISGGYMLLTHKLIKSLGGFDAKYFMYLEDIDLCKRANKRGFKVQFCPSSKIVHIGGASSKNRHKIHYTAWDNARIHYVRKHFISPTSWFLEFAIKLDILATKHRRET